MFRINLHAHTVNSDGCDTLVDMAKAAHALGHCAFVVTDHDYFAGYPRNKLIIESARAESPIPIILGSEVSTPIGECLMFGEENLEGWFEGIGPVNPGFKGWQGYEGYEKVQDKIWDRCFNFFDNRTQHDCPLILCHPYHLEDYIEHRGRRSRWEAAASRAFYHKLCAHKPIAQLLVGYEAQNGGTVFNTEGLEEVFYRMWGLKGLHRFKNSDAHMVDMLEYCCNEVDRPITTEDELLAFLRELGENMQDETKEARVIRHAHTTEGTTEGCSGGDC